MKPNLHFTVLLCCAVLPYAHAQTDHWTKVNFGNIQCEFPKAYQKIDFTGASGIYYDGGNVYMTVTNLPDTSKMKGNLDRDFTRDFMNVVHDVSKKLNGRVREFRDTVIGNMPGYVSKMEVSLGDGKKSYYELLQLLQQDTMRSFSCQYYLGDEQSLKASQRFFKSIKVTKGKSKGVPRKLGFWIGGAILLAAGVWALARKASGT